MSTVRVRMRKYDPKRGQKTMRFTHKGQKWVAGDERDVDGVTAEFLTNYEATDGRPLFERVDLTPSSPRKPEPKKDEKSDKDNGKKSDKK